jgi:uncharacterized protein (TIGR02145 family)
MKKLAILLALFSMAAFAHQGTFTDTRDKNKYKTVKIGNQTWMAENLNYQTGSSTWCDDSTPPNCEKYNTSWCYDNNASNCKKYGRLYIWEVAIKSCPDGWHLPTREEWNALIDFAGGKASKKLKSKSPKNWNGTDNYGFSALPGGSGGISEDFQMLGDMGYWWTATQGVHYGSEYAYYLSNDGGNPDPDSGAEGWREDSGSKDQSGYSVRCIQN